VARSDGVFDVVVVVTDLLRFVSRFDGFDGDEGWKRRLLLRAARDHRTFEAARERPQEVRSV
jgi:hypothetical protein